MKRIIFIIFALSYTLATSSCQRLFYMPFKESNTGKGAASLYLDGQPFRTHTDKDVSAEMSDSTIRMSFCCVGDLHTNSDLQVYIDVSAEKGSTLTNNVRYEVGQHAEITIDGHPADEGHLIFRRADKIISGNFECSFMDADSNRHNVRYGNFDLE